MERKTLERLKNLLIVLLTLSALTLAVLANRYYNFTLPFTGGEAQTGIGESDDVTEASRPVKIAVMNDYGRYGAAYDLQSVTELYDKLGRYLGEALGTVSGQALSNRDSFAAALEQPGIFYEFPGEVPLSALARWLGAGLPEGIQDAEADLFAVNLTADGSTLSYRSAGEFYVCSIGLRTDALSDMESYRPNGVAFAFELAETGEVYKTVDSFCLVWERPSVPVVTGKTVASELRNEVLSALGFNPYSDSSYTDAQGTEIFTANNSIVNLRADGYLTYRSGDAVGGELSPSERIELARSTLQSLASPGDAELYFTGEESVDGAYVLTFDYIIGGAKIRSSYGSGATVTIRGGGIGELTLYLRSYLLGSEYVELFPSLQAAAMGSGRLEVCYTDSGAEALAVGWAS